MNKKQKQPLEITTTLSIEELGELFEFFDSKELDICKVDLDDLDDNDIVRNSFECYSVIKAEKTINVYSNNVAFDLYIYNISDIVCSFNRFTSDSGVVVNTFIITVTTDRFKCFLTFSYKKSPKVKSGIKIIKEAKGRETNR